MFALAATIAALTAPAPVQALAFDGPRLAYATVHSAADCDRIRLWRGSARRTVRLGRATSCEQTSTGSGIAALSAAGDRVLWLHYAGGNIREWSLYTATASAPRPRRLRFASADVGNLPPIVVGEGDATRFGELLPYAVDREVVALRPNGSRAFSWTAPVRVMAVGAKWRAVAVALLDTRILVFENGVIASAAKLPSAASAVFVTGNGIAAQLNREAYLVSGPHVYRQPLPAEGRLRDADGTLAVYLARGRATLLGLTTGRRRDLGPATDVQLEGGTVAVASGRRIRVFRV